MKKIFYLMLFLLMTGCQKNEDFLRFKASDITRTTCKKLELKCQDIIDTDGWSNAQIKELEENFEINLNNLRFDENGWIIPDTYKVLVNYFSDVQQIDLIIKPSYPYFLDKKKVIQVNQWNSLFDFSTVIQACSDMDLPLEYNFDSAQINFGEIGEYPLMVTVTDSKGIVVHILL